MSIRLSPKHGVNPSIPVCFYCSQPKNEIILAGMIRQRGEPDSDVEAPRNAVWDMRPCDECKGFMAQGVILISAKADGDPKNPFRTGGWVVLREEAVKRLVHSPMLEQVLQRRVAFIDDATWDKIGLPRDEIQQ